MHRVRRVEPSIWGKTRAQGEQSLPEPWPVPAQSSAPAQSPLLGAPALPEV